MAPLKGTTTMAPLKDFKVDDIVSVDLSSHCKVYQKRLLGVVVRTFEAKPTRPKDHKGPWELMWGVPWEGPYPLVQVYIPSIVSGDFRGENGYYYLTAKDIEAGRIAVSNDKLVIPGSRFKIGDRVSWANKNGKPYPGTVKKVPTIKNVLLTVMWDGADAPYDGINGDQIILFDEAEAEYKRLQAVIKANRMQVELKLDAAMTLLADADRIMQDNKASLYDFLDQEGETSTRIKKAIIDTVGSVGGECD